VRDYMKPETLAHFHIEAFGDKIECNRYESRDKQLDLEPVPQSMKRPESASKKSA